MIDLANRQIWMFREPRSGSTGLTTALSTLLNKRFLFVENKKDIIYDSSVLINTHHFMFLHAVKEEHNPILLRCTRRNRTEQMLSSKTLALTRKDIKLYNIEDHTTPEQLEEFNTYLKKNNKSISKLDVFKFAMEKKTENFLWDKLASKFDNHVFYYEDLTNNIDIPILGMYNINLEIDKYTKKIPEYKKEFYTNYDSVKEWIDKCSI